MPNRRARRSAARAERRGERECLVPFCINTTRRPLDVCGHHVCDNCIYNCIGVLCKTAPLFSFACPLCRARHLVKEHTLKAVMVEHAASHEKQMACHCGASCDTRYSVRHHPCDAGCYTCIESALEVTQTWHSDDMSTDSEITSSTLSASESELAAP